MNGWTRIPIATVALAALLVAAGPSRAAFTGSDEELAQAIGDRRADLALEIEAFSKVEEGEKPDVDRASALIDWFLGTADEAEGRLEARNDASGTRKAGELRAAGEEARTAVEEYTREKASPKLVVIALRGVDGTARAVAAALER